MERDSIMSTRAALFIQTDDGDWLEIYCHFDGYPRHMLPALAAHDPARIIEAGEIRSITPDDIDAFDPPRPFRLTATPDFPGWASHAYVLTATGWRHAEGPATLRAIA